MPAYLSIEPEFRICNKNGIDFRILEIDDYAGLIPEAMRCNLSPRLTGFRRYESCKFSLKRQRLWYYATIDLWEILAL